MLSAAKHLAMLNVNPITFALSDTLRYAQSDKSTSNFQLWPFSFLP